MLILRYFIFVGLGLWGLLVASNYMLGPSQARLAAASAAANEPVKDGLYFWRQQEARNNAPVHQQFTVIPQTSIAMGKGLPAKDVSAIEAQTTTEIASSDVKPTAMAPDKVAVADKPKKTRRMVAQRKLSQGVEQQQAYQQQQEWQQQRFRQANAQATNGGGPFGLFGTW